MCAEANFSLFTFHFSLLKVVVLHLDDKDDGCTRGGDEVGNEKEDTHLNALADAQHQSLTHKTEAAQGHHAEAGK